MNNSCHPNCAHGKTRISVHGVLILDELARYADLLPACVAFYRSARGRFHEKFLVRNKQDVPTCFVHEVLLIFMLAYKIATVSMVDRLCHFLSDVCVNLKTQSLACIRHCI